MIEEEVIQQVKTESPMADIVPYVMPEKLSEEETQIIKNISKPQLDKVLNSFVNEAFDLQLLKNELPQILQNIKYSGKILTVGDIGVIQKKLSKKEGELKQIGQLLLTSPEHATKLKGFMQFGTWWTKNESKYPRQEGERSDKYRRRLKAIYDIERAETLGSVKMIA